MSLWREERRESNHQLLERGTLHHLEEELIIIVVIVWRATGERNLSSSSGGGTCHRLMATVVNLDTLLEEALGPRDLPLLPANPLPLPQDPTTTTSCRVPGCGRSVKRMWNHLFQFHKKQGQYSGKIIYIYMICEHIMEFFSFFDTDAELSAYLKAARGDSTISPPPPPPTPPTPPPTPTFQECIFDALLSLNEDDNTTASPSPSPLPKPLHTCPVRGCGKKVVRVWNHLHKVHKKKE